MAGIILKGDGFVGIADEKRAAIKQAMAAADAMGVLPDDPEKRKLIIERMEHRLSRKGWNWQKDGTVARVDDRGIARVIPQGEGIGFLPGTKGARRPTSGTATWRNIPVVQPTTLREAAARFHQRMVDSVEKFGEIPIALQKELQAEGWRQGQPVPREKIEDFSRRFQEKYQAKRRSATLRT